MAFWNLPSSEPKRQHRFMLHLPNLASANNEFTYTQYLARSVTKPAYTVGTAPHKFLGNTYYYPGIVEWSEVTANIVNSIAPDGNALLYDALTGMGYLRPDIQELAARREIAPQTPNKEGAVRTLGIVEIEELSGAGATVGTWKLNNAFITGASFGDLTYDTEEILNIEIKMRYDWATYDVGPGARAAANVT